jgi:hypothetical protein
MEYGPEDFSLSSLAACECDIYNSSSGSRTPVGCYQGANHSHPLWQCCRFGYGEDEVPVLRKFKVILLSVFGGPLDCTIFYVAFQGMLQTSPCPEALDLTGMIPLLPEQLGSIEILAL